jgi:glycerol-3-phosphate dehydrogenase (NAD(P)+)
VLGAGSWGTALAIQFARAGRDVTLWGHDQSHVAQLAATRVNDRYLPETILPANLACEADLTSAIHDTAEVLIAVPSHAFRATLAGLLDSGQELRGLAWATKGFDRDTGQLPHQIVDSLLGDRVPTAVLSGPTFAREIAAGLPSAVTIASTSHSFAESLARSIATDKFRAYTSSDVVGVEVGGATKNVYAIGAGVSDGLGFGANTRIALVTRGLAEMTRLGRKLGAKPETFMGLAGIGDLVLTCTDDQSRNRRFGLAIAHGTPSVEALAAIGQVVEGYYGALAVHRVAGRLAVDMPIVEEIYRVLYEGVDPRDAVSRLMSRPIMPESP